MQIGRYETGRVLGQGGMGTVHEATHSLTGKRVALKLLRPEVVAVPGVLQRFLNEARAACAVEHPNVVQVFDVDAEHGQAYMVIEFLEGEDFEAYLEREGPIDAATLLEIAAPLLDALQKAHEQGVVHRDIKAENVFLAQSSGQVVPKLLDFGIAKLLDGEQSQTATGHMIGTPSYFAPEYAEGMKSTHPRGDV